MAAPRIVPEQSAPDPTREFWVVQDTEPKDEWIRVFEVDPGTEPSEVRRLYLEQVVESPEVLELYDDPDEAYYLELYGPFGPSRSANGDDISALRERLTAE